MTNVIINDATIAGTLNNGGMELIPIMSSEAYTLFRRLNDNTYVVAYMVNTNFDEKTCSWGQGYYLMHKDFNKALEFFFNKVDVVLKDVIRK